MQPSERRNPLARRQDEEIALAASGDDTITELKYDYGQVDEASRKAVVAAAVEIKTHSSRAKESMIKIGQRLSSVKALLPHGQFSEWCQTEFEMSQRTAQNMMQAAEVFGGKNEIISFLSDTAMYALAAPNVPEAARIEVIEQVAQTGKGPKMTEVKQVIDKHKPSKPAPTQPTPTARPLTDEETRSLVWRAIKAEVEIAPSATAVFRWQRYLDWLARHSEPKHFKPHLIDATSRIDGQLLVNAAITVGTEIERNLESAKRAAQPTQPTPPAVDEETSEASPADLDTLPADMIERGWVLREMVATGRWWCLNPNGPRATSPYDTVAEAATAARGMQIDVAKPAVKPVAGDEVTIALQRIEEAVTDLVERLGLDMLRVRLDERQGEPWSLLASKGDNELNWSHDNIVGVSSALVNLGRKGAK